MARGASSKEAISCKILDVFPDAFVNGKEIRIPWMENGELLQIKCTLTCAKDMVEPEDGFPRTSAETSDTAVKAPATAAPASPTEEEKARVNELLNQLGIKEEF